MFPRIHLNLLGWQMTFATSNMLLPFALLVAWFGLSWGMRRKLSFLASTRVVFATVICALLGSRFLHVVWEKPRWYALHPIEVFTRFDGQVLYGAALFGLSGLAFFIRKYSPDIRKQAWDLVAIYAAIMVGILRLSCFAEGCCWGRPTSLPWAVRYFSPLSAMPWIGIPVHPVQLYESAGGFFIAALLISLYRQGRRFSGELILVLGMTYGALRFVLEDFRGDDFRGVNLIAGLSAGQILSIVVMIVSGFLFARKRLQMRKQVLVACLAFLLVGCDLPQAPNFTVVQSTQWLNKGVSVHTMTKGVPPQHYGKPAPEQDTIRFHPFTHRNLVFVATDDTIQPLFAKALQKAYMRNRPLRLEEVSWWMYAPMMQDVYDHVIRLQYDQFSRENLLIALQKAEALRDPYDLMLLTHGVPNNIVTSIGFPLFSWQDVDALAGKLPGLRLVFMQGCFSDSLVPDWLATGAHEVISYDGLNRNFFYPGPFLQNLNLTGSDVQKAYELTNAQIADDIRKSQLYRQFISALGMTVDEYLETAPNPLYSARPLP